MFKNDRRSTSGFCIFHVSHLIFLKSKKQAVVSRSSAKAEYRAMAQGTSELLWLRSLLTELIFSVTDSSPCSVTISLLSYYLLIRSFMR